MVTDETSWPTNPEGRMTSRELHQLIDALVEVEPRLAEHLTRAEIALAATAFIQRLLIVGHMEVIADGQRE